MQLCVHGHWINDRCTCLDFWQGKACDERDCGQFGTGHDHGPCNCDSSHIGEFCQYEICYHNNQWYCNATTPISGESGRRVCPTELVAKWFTIPSNITSNWFCDCEFGSYSNGTCLCDEGYDGTFCQSSSCPQGDTWNASSQSCGSTSTLTESAAVNSTVHYGFFGYDINQEFTISAGVCFLAIFLFFAIGRLTLKRIDKKIANATKTPIRRRRRKSTFSDYFDQYHKPHVPSAQKPGGDSVLKARTIEKLKRHESDDETQNKNSEVSTDTTRSDSGVGQIIHRKNDRPIYRRSNSLQSSSEISILETVIEGRVFNPSRPDSGMAQDEEDMEEEIEDEKYRQSMMNFASQISITSDMA